MFDSVGWGEVLVVVVAALFVLGPERLPGAAAWLGSAIRRAKEVAAGAVEQVREEIGPEVDQLREPFAELGALCGPDPRRAVLNALGAESPTLAGRRGPARTSPPRAAPTPDDPAT